MNGVVHTQVLNALLVEFSHDCGCVCSYLMYFIVVFFGCLFAKKDIRRCSVFRRNYDSCCDLGKKKSRLFLLSSRLMADS